MTQANPPKISHRFDSLPLNQELLSNLQSLSYTAMTEVQAQTLPVILAGHDVIGQAMTGSGKTAAFGLALLHNLKVKQFRVQSLVLCPTRELADQVAKEIRKLARGTHNIKVLTLCGGMPFGPQLGSLEHGAHIVVGTPGRIEEHLRKGSLKLTHVNMLVLDEADRMLDMGFQPSVDTIVSYTPDERQTLLFSATFQTRIKEISQRVMTDPQMITVASTHDDSSIKQVIVRLGETVSRFEALTLVLQDHRPDSTLIFCNTKRETEEVATALQEDGFVALALHGDLEQKMRDQILVRFSNKSASVLVATDVAARGLDIDALDMVVNFSLSKEHDVHVHRVGRTGRAGSSGMAITLVNNKDMYKLGLLEDRLGQKFEQLDINAIRPSDKTSYQPPMATLQIDGGKKQKLRPGDILGALTAQDGLEGSQVGKIHIFDNTAYVAVRRSEARTASSMLSNGKLKGRSFRSRRIS